MRAYEKKSYLVMAKNNRTGRVFGDRIEAQNEVDAEDQFTECYGYSDNYTILSIEEDK